MRIDMHAHFIPRFLLDAAAQNPHTYGIRVERASNGRTLRHREGFGYPVPDTFTEGTAMIAAMDQLQLDARVVSLCPTLFFDTYAAQIQVPFIRSANEFAAELSHGHPGRLWAMGSVPLPHVEDSVAELDRIKSLGLVGVEIPCTIAGRTLDDPLYRPFFARVAELNLPVFLHPVYLGPKPGLEEFYFVNSIGNPYETMVAAARLLHSGMLAELPDLRFILAHGGGFFPYQRGRFQHAWKVRTEPRAGIDRPPLDYADALFFDSLTHDPVALRFLIEAFGVGKVLMGSDFPFDMGTADAVADVAGANLPEPVLRQVQGENAVRLFRLTAG